MLHDLKGKQIWNKFPGRLTVGFLSDESHFNFN